MPEVRAAQAALARQYGIAAFCWWHYWSLGRRLLERPFQKCSSRANLTFRSASDGLITLGRRIVPVPGVDRRGPGIRGRRRSRPSLRRAGARLSRSPLSLRRGAPLFYLFFHPHRGSRPAGTRSRWTKLAHESGLPGIHFVGQSRGETIKPEQTLWTTLKRWWRCVSLQHTGGRLVSLDRLRNGPIRLPPDAYAAAQPELVPGCPTSYPCVLSNWDDTPRWGRRGYVLLDPDADNLAEHVRAAVRLVAGRAPDERIAFVKSWNESAEGNHLEPDRRHGRRRLEAILAGLGESSGGSS